MPEALQEYFNLTTTLAILFGLKWNVLVIISLFFGRLLLIFFFRRREGCVRFFGRARLADPAFKRTNVLHVGKFLFGVTKPFLFPISTILVCIFAICDKNKKFGKKTTTAKHYTKTMVSEIRPNLRLEVKRNVRTNKKKSNFRFFYLQNYFEHCRL